MNLFSINPKDIFLSISYQVLPIFVISAFTSEIHNEETVYYLNYVIAANIFFIYNFLLYIKTTNILKC